MSLTENGASTLSTDTDPRFTGPRDDLGGRYVYGAAVSACSGSPARSRALTPTARRVRQDLTDPAHSGRRTPHTGRTRRPGSARAAWRGAAAAWPRRALPSYPDAVMDDAAPREQAVGARPDGEARVCGAGRGQPVAVTAAL